MTFFRSIFIAPVAMLALGGAGWLGWSSLAQSRAVADLADRTRANLIFVKGGTFDAGNYKINLRLPDGSQERRWIIEPLRARTPKTVTLNSYYILADEASAKDHAIFLASQNRYPPLDNALYPDGSTAMSYSEADDYCNWLGALIDLPLRLPTEDEWEFAARTRGVEVAFATNDGEFRWGENVQDNDYDTPPNPLKYFSANPLGLRDLVEGAYEWIYDPAQDDPEGIRIAKGSSSQSSSFYETIPGSYKIDPLSGTQIALLGSRVQSLAALGPVHLAQTTARCVAPVEMSPDHLGLGALGGNFDTVPEAYGPYDQQSRLIE